MHIGLPSWSFAFSIVITAFNQDSKSQVQFFACVVLWQALWFWLYTLSVLLGDPGAGDKWFVHFQWLGLTTKRQAKQPLHTVSYSVFRIMRSAISYHTGVTLARPTKSGLPRTSGNPPRKNFVDWLSNQGVFWEGHGKITQPLYCRRTHLIKTGQTFDDAEKWERFERFQESVLVFLATESKAWLAHIVFWVLWVFWKHK